MSNTETVQQKPKSSTKAKGTAQSKLGDTAELSYNGFFGFEEVPFSISPNPRFLYMSEQHQEALAHLLYGVSASNGFVLLTGEVGTGKTTVIRAFLQHLPEDARVAYILHAKLSAMELLETIVEELNIDMPDIVSPRSMIGAIHKKLLKNFAAGFRTFLLIDEAQNLSADVLEEIRLLTNLETDEGKLLHIILVGQPELKVMFQTSELRQLNQRITARYHLKQLSDDDVALYVQHRLAVAQAPRNPFTSKAMKALARYSMGIPRLLNVLSDRALLAGFSQHSMQVDHLLVKAAAKEVMGSSGGGYSVRDRVRGYWYGRVLNHDTDQSQRQASPRGTGSKFALTGLVIGVFILLLGPMVQDKFRAVQKSLNAVAEDAVDMTEEPHQESLVAESDIKERAEDRDNANVELQIEGVEESLETQAELIVEPDAGSEPALAEAAGQVVSADALDKPSKTAPKIVPKTEPKTVSNKLKPTTFEEILVVGLEAVGQTVTPTIESQVLQQACDGLPGERGCLEVQKKLDDLLELDTPFLFKLAPGQMRSLGVEFNTKRDRITGYTWFSAEEWNSGSNQLLIRSPGWQEHINVDDFKDVFVGEAVLLLQTPVASFERSKPLSIEHGKWIIGHIGFAGGESLDPVFDVIVSQATLKSAVRAFQDQRGLVADGLFGLRTLIELNRMVDADFPRLKRLES